ncbi:hypothetical protein ACOJUR_12865 [Alicyclobacillus tolerans]
MLRLLNEDFHKFYLPMAAVFFLAFDKNFFARMQDNDDRAMAMMFFHDLNTSLQ